MDQLNKCRSVQVICSCKELPILKIKFTSANYVTKYNNNNRQRRNKRMEYYTLAASNKLYCKTVMGTIKSNYRHRHHYSPKSLKLLFTTTFLLI
jgi:hypothetical protein